MFPPPPPGIVAQQAPQQMDPSLMAAFGSGRQGGQGGPALSAEVIQQARMELEAIGQAGMRLVSVLRVVAPHALAFVPPIINAGKAITEELAQIEQRIQSQSGGSELPETPSPSAQMMGVPA